MKRLLLPLFICLFQFFSTEARAGVSEEALRLERIHFEATDPLEAERALVQKAAVLLAAADTAGCEQTLRRVSMYILDTEGRRAADSLRLATAAPRPLAQPQGPRRAALWAFLPPVGHIMAGEPLRGVAFTAADLGALTFGVFQIASGTWITGYLCGGLILLQTYFNESLRVAEKLD